MLGRLSDTAAELGLPFEAVELERLGEEADVIISITSSFGPLLMDHHVKGPTHIAAMGTDTKGKQELDPALVARSKLFADEIAQSVSIGEYQHAIAKGLIAESAIRQLGAVVTGDDAGRGDAEVTIFDGTGVGLQDLAVAAKVVELAKQKGIGQEVTL
jgi:ornithine cyclodeaminase